MILVTGGAGYIGSHCVIALLNKGYNVIIFDNEEIGHVETVQTLMSLNLKGKLEDYTKGDMRSASDIEELFQKHKKIEAVIHFAAYSQVAESILDPAKYYCNNVCGAINLLEAMRSNGIERIVFSSTAATYGEPKYIPIDEKHPQVPVNAYGTTKLIVERILDDYSEAYGLRSVKLRYFNVVGADSEHRIGEWHNPETHLIPNIIKSSLDGEKTFKLFGNDYHTRDGTCVRDYVNVEDLVEAHVLALNYLMRGGETDSFNLGTREGNTVREVFKECEKIIGKKIELEIESRRPGDPAVLVADNTKARDILGWTPRHTLADSIRTAYAWELKKR